MALRNYDTEASDLFLACLIRDPAAFPLFADRVDETDLPLQQALILRAVSDCIMNKASPTIHELSFRLERTKQGALSALEIVGQDYLEALFTLLEEKGVRDTKKIALFCERIEVSTEKAIIDDLYHEAEEAMTKPNLNFDAWFNDMISHVMDKRKKKRLAAKQITEYWPLLEPALDAWQAGQVYMRIPTGWGKLDDFIGGGIVRKGLTILAGPPGSSKTTAAITWSRNQAKAGYNVGWSSIEMPGEMLLLRLITTLAGIDWTRLTAGQLRSPLTKQGLEKARDGLAKLPLYIDDRYGVSTDDVYLQALNLDMKLENGLDIWYVDFAQLLSDIGDDPTDKAARIFRKGKGIGRLLDIGVVAISQVRKNVEGRLSKLPTAADVPYSGHDVADGVLMPWDVYSYYVKGEIEVAKGIKDLSGNPINVTDPNNWYLVIAKYRYAAGGILRLYYDRSTGLIRDPSWVNPAAF